MIGAANPQFTTLALNVNVFNDNNDGHDDDDSDEDDEDVIALLLRVRDDGKIAYNK